MSEPAQIDDSRRAREEPAAGVHTFLFADIRGYTRFTVDRGDEAAAALARKFVSLAKEGIAAREGRVVEVRGDEVFAVFLSARNALRAAVELQDRFAQEMETDPELPLAVGMGIDAGEAVPVEGGFRGSALNLAARLCSLAGPGEVLVSESVTHLARKTVGLSYVERGPVDLKGFVEPTRVMQVVSEAADGQQPARVGAVTTAQAEASLPIGAYLGSLPSGPMVAREEELGTILTAIDATADGAGQLLMLAGQRGIGKTRLAQEATLIAHKRGFLIASGRCYESDREVPYFPFFEALGMTLAKVSSTLRFETPRRWPHLAQLLPEQLATPTPDPSTSPHEEQQRLFRAVNGFLSAATANQPVALLLDDLQWADEGTLRLLAHLARNTRHQGVLIVGTYRDEPVGAERPLDRVLRELTRERLVERLTLRRLPQDGTAALVTATIGDMETSEEFIEFVHRRTKGVPIFIEEILRSLGGHYRLVREIGAGGMGRVFQAVDNRTGTAVAAKIMFASREAGDDAALRFQREGAVLAELEHPNIVKVYGTFIEEHASCIIMELLEGRTLGESLSTESWDLERVKTITMQVASALAFAHKRGIVHRDVKPDNVMIVSGDRVKVTDFGIARVLRPEATMHTMTSTGMTLGTPLYMSPEQIEGKHVDGRADIYALGAVMYQMVTGRPVFEGQDSITIAFKHVRDTPIPPSELSPSVGMDWEETILKALAKDPSERFQTAAEMEAAIAGLSTEPRAEPASANTLEETKARSGVSLPVPRPITLAKLRAATRSRVTLPSTRSAHRRSVPAWYMSIPLAIVVVVAGWIAHGSLASGTLSANGVRIGKPVPNWGMQPLITPLNDPVSVALDRSGNIYVVDQLNYRVEKLTPSGQPLATWGSQGSGPGQFSLPTGIAVDANGNVYVADVGNKRVDKLSSDGRPQAGWGTGNGVQLSSPTGVTVDGRGNVWVVDAGNNSVEELSSAGSLQRTIGSFGANGSQFSGPQSVALDDKGDIYVADTGNNRIVSLSRTGVLKGTIGQLGSAPGSLAAPGAVAIGPRGDVFVADTGNSRIERFSPSGHLVMAQGKHGSLPGEFASPSGLAVDARGSIFVSDNGNNRIQKLSAADLPIAQWGAGTSQATLVRPAGVAVNSHGHVFVTDTGHDRIWELSSGGQLLNQWGASGSGTGQLNTPWGIAVDHLGELFVADAVNARVQRLSVSAGNWTTVGAGSTSLNAPYGLAVDRAGDIYVADNGTGRIEKLSGGSGVSGQWTDFGSGFSGSPYDVAVDERGNVYVADDTNDRVQELSPSGAIVRTWDGSASTASGATPKMFHGPAGVAVDAHGNIYVTDSGNNRVVELSPGGAPISHSRSGGLSGPTGVAVDARGNVYVADTGNDRVVKFLSRP